MESIHSGNSGGGCGSDGGISEDTRYIIWWLYTLCMTSISSYASSLLYRIISAKRDQVHTS